MTAQTPIYAIKYPVVGEPIRTTRQILEDNAKAIEAALLAGPASPPNAQDLAAVAGRVTTLETHEPKVLAHVEAVPATGWALWADQNYARMTWTLHRNGMATVTGAMTTAASGFTAQVCALPSAAFAPRVTSQAGVGTQIGFAMVSESPRLAEIRSGGLYLRGAAPTSGQYIFVNITYPTTAVSA